MSVSSQVNIYIFSPFYLIPIDFEDITSYLLHASMPNCVLAEPVFNYRSPFNGALVK